MNQAGGEDIEPTIVIPSELKTNGVTMPAQQQVMAPEFANPSSPSKGDGGHQHPANNKAPPTTANGIHDHSTMDNNNNNKDNHDHQSNGNDNPDNNTNTEATKQAIKDLHSILDRLIQMDPNRWFQHPVQEKEAPDYYQIIKEPMCFDIMHKKIDNQQYVNWTDLVKDLELICNNAMKYNQKRSRVHQRALVMLRAGKKVLMDYELEGRRALSVLHPSAAGISGISNDVAATAAAAAITPMITTTMGVAAPLGSGGELVGSGSLPPSMSLHMTPSLQLTGSFGGLTPRFGLNATDDDDEDNTMGRGDDHHNMDSDYDDMVNDIATGTAGVQPWDAPHDDGGYSSFEATDLEDDDGGGGSRKMPSFTSSLALTRGSATVVKLPWVPSNVGIGTDDANVPAAHNMGLTEEWKNARRNVEWRIRWLEMRLRELQHHRNRYADALEKEKHRKKTSDTINGGDGSAQDKQVETTTTEPATTTTTASRKKRKRKEIPELTMPNLLKHPFFKDHSMIRNSQPKDGGDTIPSSSAPADEPDFPARAHAVLDILSRQLADLRGQVESLQPSAQAGMMAMQRGGIGGRHHHGSRYGGGSASRRARGYLTGGRVRGRPSSNRHHHMMTMDEGKLSKKRREHYSMMNDVVTQGAFSPKFVERLPVRNIDTPGVKELPADEMEKMYAAVDKAQRDIRSGVKEASEAIDALVAELCEKNTEEEDGKEEEEEEATDDEAFAARHAPLEEREKTVFASYVGGGAQRRQKSRSKDISKDGKKPRGRPPSAFKLQMMVGAGSGGVEATDGAGGQQQIDGGGMVKKGSVTSHQEQQQQEHKEQKSADKIVMVVPPVMEQQQTAPVANGKVLPQAAQKVSKKGRPKKVS